MARFVESSQEIFCLQKERNVIFNLLLLFGDHVLTTSYLYSYDITFFIKSHRLVLQ